MAGAGEANPLAGEAAALFPQAVELLAPHGALRASVRGGASGFESGSAEGFAAFYPSIYGETFVLMCGRQRVSIRPAGAFGAPAEAAGGQVAYRGVFPNTDSLHVPGADRSEEFLILWAEDATRVFEYEILGMEGVGEVLLNDGAVMFTPSLQAASPWISLRNLEIAKPYVIDAEGRRSETAARWEVIRVGGNIVLRLTVDASGLAFPLLVDPLYLTTGALNVSRCYYTATLLNNGKVLVAGGFGGSPAAVLNSAELYDPVTGVWTATGAMTDARYFHTATLLPNGKVLVTGGSLTGGGATTHCELYDPSAGTWSPADSMNMSRYSHTATLLDNGNVLVAGGYNGTDVTDSAEIYYAATTEMWGNTGSLTTARQRHTATLLSSGKVLVAGGQTFGPSPAYFTSCETYDPSSKLWTAAGSMSNARAQHGAVLFPNGFVLAVGGTDGGYLASCELFNPAGGGGAGSWSAAPALGTARMAFSLTLLPSGKLLAAGGYVGATTGTSHTELFDPAASGGAGAWSFAGVMGSTRGYHTATILPCGRVLIAGGRDGATFRTSCELYDYYAPTLSSVATGGGRLYFTLTPLPNGKVLAAAGKSKDSGADQYLNTAELYDPATGAVTSTGSLAALRSGHAAVLLTTGKVLVVGGWNASGPTLSGELYNPAAGTWSATGALGTGRDYLTATLLADGKVLAAGGRNGTSMTAVELYDPVTGLFDTGAANLTHWREQHAAVLLTSGKVLVSGGYDSYAGSAIATCELYDPAANTWTDTDSLTTARYRHTMTLLPTGKVLVAGGTDGTNPLVTCEIYDPALGTWGAAGSLIAARSHHAAVVGQDGRVLIGGGQGVGGSFPTIEIYEAARNAWASGGTMSAARTYLSAALLSTGQAILWGGKAAASTWPATADLWNPGLGFTDSRRPGLTTAGNVTQPNGLILMGSGFKGDSEASTGGVQSSPTNIPAVQLQRIDNGQLFRFTPTPITDWSDTYFKSTDLCGFPFGHCYATVFTNGIPATSMVNLITGSTVKVSGGGSYCGTGSATIRADITGGLSPWNITWSDGLVQNGITGTVVTRSVSPTVTTTYTITSITGNGCAGASYGEAVVEVGAPLGDTDAGSNAPLCAGGGTDLQLWATCATSGVNYEWEGPNGFTSGEQNPVIANPTPANAGLYVVTYTKGGCTEQRGVQVNIWTDEPTPTGNDLHASKSGANLTLTWTAVPEADAYYVYYTDDCVAHPWPDPYSGTTAPAGWTAWSPTPTPNTTVHLNDALSIPGLRYVHVVPTNACGTNFSQPR